MGMRNNSTLPSHSWTVRVIESAILNTKLKLKLSNLPEIILTNYIVCQWSFQD